MGWIDDLDVEALWVNKEVQVLVAHIMRMATTDANRDTITAALVEKLNRKTIFVNTTAPATTYPGQLWFDTTGLALKIRDADNDSWDGKLSIDCIPTMDDAHIPDLETLSYGAAFALAQIPTMDDAHIPDIETLSYGAAFAAAQIPNLDAAKITTGTLAWARSPFQSWSQLITQVTNIVGDYLNVEYLVVNDVGVITSAWNLVNIVNATLNGNLLVYGSATIGTQIITSSEDKTISGGVITVTKTRVIVDTEEGAAQDDLDTINGGTDGALLYVFAKHTDRTVTLKSGTGNMCLSGDLNIVDDYACVVLIYNGAKSCWTNIQG